MSEDDEKKDQGLTTQTGLVWEWLPTLVAGFSQLSFIGLIVASTLPVPVELSGIPAEWFAVYMMIVGGSTVTTIGADAIASFQELR